MYYTCLQLINHSKLLLSVVIQGHTTDHDHGGISHLLSLLIIKLIVHNYYKYFDTSSRISNHLQLGSTVSVQINVPLQHMKIELFSLGGTLI